MTASARSREGKDPLDEAFERLGKLLPPVLARALRWVHAPHSRYVRIPLGILCIAASFFWFLPIVGLEYLPIGLLLIAQDVPFLRRPVGRFMLRLLDGAEGLKKWWKAQQARRASKRGRHP